MVAPKDNDSPAIGFAHRGARSERPENTLEAFSWALALGATGLESDAWVTADGVVILDHDGVVGPLWRRKAIATQVRASLPPHIPDLADLYGVCGAGFELSLDIKDPAALPGILEVAGRAGATRQLWLCHHDWRLLAGWKTSTGDAHLVDSTNMAWLQEGLGPRTAALRGAGIDAVNLNGHQWDGASVAEVQRAGLKAFAWDAQTAENINRLLDLGVDGLYSDHVGRLMECISARTDRS